MDVIEGEITQREIAAVALEGLRQVGSGWHLNVAAAIARGDHEKLGMSRREFATAAGGFKLTDPRDAILDLFKSGLSQRAIAEILSVSHEGTVRRILREEGLIEGAPERRALPEVALSESGDSEESAPERRDSEAEELREQLRQAKAEIGKTRYEEKEKARIETKKLRASLKKAREEVALLKMPDPDHPATEEREPLPIKKPEVHVGIGLPALMYDLDRLILRMEELGSSEMEDDHKEVVSNEYKERALRIMDIAVAIADGISI